MENTKLLKIIEEMIIENTFNLDAAEKVTELKKNAMELDKELKEYEENTNYYRKECEEKDNKIFDLNNEIKTLKSKVEDLESFKKSHDEIKLKYEIACEYEASRRADLFHLIGLIFKNPQFVQTTQETESNNIPIMNGNGGYVNNYSESKNKTTTITTEQTKEDHT